MSALRLYHFLPEEFALDDIEKRRIKVGGWPTLAARATNRL